MEDDLISSIYRKIEREKVLITAARSMRQSTDNASVQQSLDSNIRESQKNIAYLEERMRELQNRHMQGVSSGVAGMSLGGSSEGGPPPPPKDPVPKGGYYDSSQGNMVAAPHPPFAQQSGPGVPKPRPNYSKLGI